MVKSVVLHKVWSAWSLTTGKTLFVITTSSEATQVPFVTVQRKVALVPAANPVTVVVGELAVVIVAVPLTKLQTPVPTVGALWVMVKSVVSHKICSAWSLTTGNSSTVIVPVAFIAGLQPPVKGIL